MKKITLLLFTLSFACGFSQQKSTGTVTFLPGLSANLMLNDATSTAELTITGPADRWFAVTIGTFGTSGAMSAGNDVVYYNGTTLIDATHNGQGATPSVDTNNWTLQSNTVDGSVRTIVATRPFVAQPTDYTFNFNDSTISLAGAHAASAIQSSLQYHQNNRFNAGSVPLLVLGTTDFSLNGSQIYPNPAEGEFLIESKRFIETVSIYSQTGALVRTVKIDAMAAKVNVDGLASGVYLIELQNGSEKSWKKIIIK